MQRPAASERSHRHADLDVVLVLGVLLGIVEIALETRVARLDYCGAGGFVRHRGFRRRKASPAPAVYTCDVDPLRRLRRLSERNDAEDQRRAQGAHTATVSERLAQALELSDMARELAGSVGAEWVTSPPRDLQEKALRYPTSPR